MISKKSILDALERDRKQLEEKYPDIAELSGEGLYDYFHWTHSESQGSGLIKNYFVLRPQFHKDPYFENFESKASIIR